MTKEELKEAVAEAIQDKLGEFYLEWQKQLEHHCEVYHSIDDFRRNQFIDNVMNVTDKVKGTACKTITTSGIIGLLTILILGLITWIKEHLK